MTISMSIEELLSEFVAAESIRPRLIANRHPAHPIRKSSGLVCGVCGKGVNWSSRSGRRYIRHKPQTF